MRENLDGGVRRISARGKKDSGASSCRISERDCDADKMLCGAMAPSSWGRPLVKGGGGA